MLNPPRSVAFLTAFLLAWCAAGLAAQADPARALAACATVPIMVMEGFTEDGKALEGASALVSPTLQRLFLHAGAPSSVVPSGEAAPAGLVITSNVSGRSLDALYQGIGAGRFFTGAEAMVVLEISLDGRVLLAKSFTGTYAPPNFYTPGSTHMRPFDWAVAESGFYPFMLQLLDSAYGAGVLSRSAVDSSLDSRIRLAALSLLRTKGPEAAEPVLLQALHASSSDIRSAAAGWLGDIKSLKAVDGLMEGLKDYDVRVRCSAAQALGKILDPRAGPALAAASRDDDRQVRVAAAISLAALRDPSAPEAVVRVLQANDFPWSDPKPLAQSIMSLGKDPDPGRQARLSTAIKALEEAKAVDVDALFNLLQRDDLRDAVLVVLGRLAAPEVEDRLILILDRPNNTNTPQALRSAIIDALRRKGDQKAVEALCRCFLSNADLHIEIDWAFTQMDDPLITATLIAALGDARRGVVVRTRAASLLAKRGGPPALDALGAALSDANEYVGEAAAKALRARGDANAIPPLVAAIQRGKTRVASAAIESLAGFRDPRVVPSLIEALGSGKEEVRIQAALSLGDLKDGRATEPLVAALRDTSHRVVMEAANAIRGMGDEKTADLLIAHFQKKENTPADLAPLALALGYMKAPKAAPLLVKALFDNSEYQAPVSSPSNDSVISFPRSLLDALQAINDPASMDQLINGLRDWSPTKRVTAARALGYLKAAGAVKQLNAALSDWDPRVREEAARALKSISDH